MYQSYFLDVRPGGGSLEELDRTESMVLLGEDHVTIFLLRKAEGVTKVMEDGKTWKRKCNKKSNYESCKILKG